jgi:CzcA family heavy metal efflux pump
VAIWGQRDRQFQVRVDPDRLLAHGITLDSVVRAAGEAATIGAGGFVDMPNQRMAVRHMSPIIEPADLARTVVEFRGGSALRLGDVADVVTDYPAPIGDAVVGDSAETLGPGLLLIVEKQPWGNTLDVTRDVESALESLRPALGGVRFDSTIFRPATFIEQSVRNLTHAMLVGCALVAVILIGFLFDWRTAAISIVAIPLSLCGAAIVLYYWGGTINTMVLAGLVIAVGEVVDDAIIDVENIMRRLRQRKAESGGSRAEGQKSAFQIVLDASLEVRSAVVFASFIVMLVFLPIFFLDGLAGTFFRPLAAAYVLAILASLAVALTVTPAMALILLPGAPDRRRDAPLVRALKEMYRAVLPTIVARPWLVAAALVLAFVLTGVAVPYLGEEFLPNFKERDFLMHWVERPGTSLDAMRRITEQAGRELLAIPGVRNFGSHIGRAEVADEVVGPNFTELWISLDPDADYSTTVAKVQEVVDGYPGLYRDLLTYLKERIKEVLSGTGATVVVRVFGPDLAVLRDKAHEIERLIADVPGVTNLKVEPQVLVPQIEVRLRPEAAERFGLTPGQARRAAVTLVKGTKVGEVYDQQKVFDVAVWGNERLRTDLAALRELRIEGPGGSQFPLGDVADVAIVPTPNEIKREGASRRLDVMCNVSGRDLGSVAREIQEKLRGVRFEREYHSELLGEYAAREQSRRRLFALTALALVGILLLLYMDFASFRLTMLVFLTVPFALIGGVAAAFVSGGVLSLGSLVGFVTVLGIAARNGIMLVSHYRHLELDEHESFGFSLVLRGAEERLAPILMTALCAGLALVPLVIRGNVPGHEIEYPMAVVILGGLFTSTLLNLFFLPALYLAIGRSARPSTVVGH